jgi:hypothetical protein
MPPVMGSKVVVSVRLGLEDVPVYSLTRFSRPRLS